MPHLVDSVLDTFKRNNVVPMAASSGRYCFNLVGIAGKDTSLVVKVEETLERCSITIAKELAGISDLLDTSCLIVSSMYRGRRLIKGIFYRRYGIFAVNVETLDSLLRGESVPFVYTSQGGVYVKLDASKIREARERRGMSLGELAYQVGVSRKAVYEYERGRMDATPEVALRLEEVLKESVVKRVTIKDLREVCKPPRPKRIKERPHDMVLSRLVQALEELGFRTRVFAKTPFHVASKKESASEGVKKLLAKHVKVADLDEEANRLTVAVAKATGAKVFFVADKCERASEGDIVVVNKDSIKEGIVKEILGDSST